MHTKHLGLSIHIQHELSENIIYYLLGNQTYCYAEYSAEKSQNKSDWFPWVKGDFIPSLFFLFTFICHYFLLGDAEYVFH